MRVPSFVHVCNTVHNLFDDYPTEVLWHPLIRQFLNMMVQACSHALLHHQMHVCPLVNHFKQRHNIRMVQIRQRINLAMDCLSRFLIVQILLFIRLYRCRILSLLMHRPLNYSKCTRPNLQPQPEVLYYQRLFFGALAPSFLYVVHKCLKPSSFRAVFLHVIVFDELYAIIL